MRGFLFCSNLSTRVWFLCASCNSPVAFGCIWALFMSPWWLCYNTSKSRFSDFTIQPLQNPNPHPQSRPSSLKVKVKAGGSRTVAASCTLHVNSHIYHYHGRCYIHTHEHEQQAPTLVTHANSHTHISRCTITPPRLAATSIKIHAYSAVMSTVVRHKPIVERVSLVPQA